MRGDMAHTFARLQLPPGGGWRLFLADGGATPFLKVIPTSVNRPYSISLTSPKLLRTLNAWSSKRHVRHSFLPPTTRSLSTDNFLYPVVHGAETSFKALHSFSHLPWWAVVVAATVLLRSLLTLPLAVYQSRVVAKMELLLPTLKEYQEAVKHNVITKCRRANLPVEEANRRLKIAAKEVTRDLYAQEGCNPYKVALLPWIQLPLWITLSFALRNMAGVFPGGQTPPASPGGCSDEVVVAALSSEGCLWFQDLTIPDPYHVLPVLLVASNLGNIELHALRKQTLSRSRRIFTNSLRLLSVAMLFVATQMPAVMTLYWATSSTFGLLQNVLFNFPRVRRGLKIPRTPSESQTPFRDLWSVARDKSRAFVSLQREASRK